MKFGSGRRNCTRLLRLMKPAWSLYHYPAGFQLFDSVAFDLATSLTTLRLGRLIRSACTERSRPSRSGLERIRTSTLSDPVLSRTRIPIPPQARAIWSGWARVDIYRTAVRLWFDSADHLSGVGLAHHTSPRPFFQDVKATTRKRLH